ncbi:MAG: sulfite exporter TauE/SafE family protein [candidate division Zixibacteria bacterium]|nr:sulfite exporter TauE/SafE family protein [candidate division Zixibacteria bacterium]
MELPISGVETYWWLPSLVAFLISCMTVTAGISGAFLLLPFQMSVLGYTAPGVSSTNLFYNIVSIPSGVYRYSREKRMIWPLAWAIVIGIVPGMFLGALIRVHWLPDPVHFKPFAGLVLGVIGIRLLLDVIKGSRVKVASSGGNNSLKGQTRASAAHENDKGSTEATDVRFILSKISYRFRGESFSVNTPGLILLSLVVGIAGGAYGIGGGAVVAPFLVAMIGLPIYTIAGATLFSTLVGSIGGVVSYYAISLASTGASGPASPDWLLGGLLGVGGMAGMYVGARLQRYLPARLIKSVLTVCLLAIATKYIAVLFG